jgi:glutathione S-transferase
MVTLYDNLPSGNGYKCRLVLHQLQRPFKRVEKDVTKGETRTPAFLAKNPNGKIPLLELEDGRILSESNAIILYLAEGSPLVPSDAFERAQVMQWLFYEQYSHEPNIATARFWIHDVPDHDKAALAKKQELGRFALALMDRHLESRTFFVGERYTIADVALYAYTHVAGEGGFDLAAYPAVRAWLARVAAQPRHVPITQGTF